MSNENIYFLFSRKLDRKLYLKSLSDLLYYIIFLIFLGDENPIFVWFQVIDAKFQFESSKFKYL